MGVKSQKVHVMVSWTGTVEKVKHDTTADEGLRTSLQRAERDGVEEG